MTHQTMAAHTGVSNDMEMCIEICQECHATCLETVMHCLSMGGEHATPAHIGTLTVSFSFTVISSGPSLSAVLSLV